MDYELIIISQPMMNKWHLNKINNIKILKVKKCLINLKILFLLLTRWKTFIN
jgi:hypothetical protein